MNEDWEYSDTPCPKCGEDMATRLCDTCGGEGYIEDDDGVNGLETERCDNCKGGHQTWCRECGWDADFKCFLSPRYKAEWLAKQKNSLTMCINEGETMTMIPASVPGAGVVTRCLIVIRNLLERRAAK